MKSQGPFGLPVEALSVYLLIGLIGFATADLGALFIRGQMAPVAPPPAQPTMRTALVQGGNFGGITTRNFFNADGKIAPPLGQGQGPARPADAPPVPSNLPLVLLGTIVHANPARSVATIQVKSKSQEIAVRVEDVIPDNLATMVKIERAKIIFRNLSTQRLEFIEMKDDARINFGAAVNKPIQQGEVTKMSDTDFSIKRDDINRLTQNLPEILQQARAVPRMNGAGQIECWSLANIAPGSIYERLGLKAGDCLKSVNGERVDSPTKALELYNALRANANAINLGVERSGRDEQFNYNITQ